MAERLQRLAEQLAPRSVELESARTTAALAAASHDALILSGDIGGTRSRLQLWRAPQPSDGWGEDGVKLKIPGELVFEQKYLNESFPTFTSICTGFIADASAAGAISASGTTVAAATFAMAGPVNAYLNQMLFTNKSTWGLIEGSELAKALNIPVVKLVNDFVANGYGLLTLDDSEVFSLQDSVPEQRAPIACIGAGTGLGEAYLTWATDRYVVHASEGGHADFAPRTELEMELLAYLKNRYRNTTSRGSTCRVSVERVASGTGMANTYDFLAQRFPEKLDAALHAEIVAAGDMKAAVISQNGKGGKRDLLCRMTMEIFCSTFGSEAGDLALKLLPTGGMYIAGGIAPRNLSYLAARRTRTRTNGDIEMLGFMHSFLDKGRMTELLGKVPVYVVLAEDIGQRGAHLLAYQTRWGVK